MADAAVEETMKRINSHKGVTGIIIVNNDGIPIRTTLDSNITVQYAALVTHMASKARSVVRTLDPQNDLVFLRIRSKKHEIMVAPETEYVLIVVQNPSAT
ncbi:Dynein light chain roadblock-type 2 [Cymbomonas tetramitiformis]|uniref:Dynein light chain roadblock n=1 Tax=Cymbomonas tetramitiformis TaxID=36881 RepID=A0AAE0BNH0_9CHLO|nr:Dynein light chain roadblock-type 2 [Cymbomonas tetramitiformis]